MKGSYLLSHFTGFFRNQFRGLARYSGEYNILLICLGFIYFDHFLEKRIRRDLQRLLTIKRSVDKLKDDAPQLDLI